MWSHLIGTYILCYEYTGAYLLQQCISTYIYNKVCINSLLCEDEILDEEYDKLFIPDPRGTPLQKNTGNDHF